MLDLAKTYSTKADAELAITLAGYAWSNRRHAWVKDGAKPGAVVVASDGVKFIVRAA